MSQRNPADFLGPINVLAQAEQRINPMAAALDQVPKPTLRPNQRHPQAGSAGDLAGETAIPVEVVDVHADQKTHEQAAPQTAPQAVPNTSVLAEAEEKLGSNGSEETSYTVKPGDTLWDIAQLVYGDPRRWKELAAANGIENPDLIQPGQVLKF